jgi:hypothetical protein
MTAILSKNGNCFLLCIFKGDVNKKGIIRIDVDCGRDVVLAD